MRLCRCSGHSGTTATIATQFGLAMMPIWRAIAPGFTSGTTSGTPGSMRNAEELSTTTAPCRTAIGANRRDTVLPAENSAISTPGKLSSFSSSTAMPWPRNSSFRPADRPEANRRSRSSGKLRLSRQPISSPPTAPVAPTMATVGWCRLMTLAPFVGPEDECLRKQRPRPMPAGPWVVLCRCRQHAHAQDARPKGFQFVIVRLLTRRDI